MATTTPADLTATKSSVEQLDTISVTDYPQKPQHHFELDKFGAAEKSDPAEIALVRKIDLYMLPILWLMYCKCTRTAICEAFTHFLTPMQSSTSWTEMQLSTARSMALIKILE